MAAVVRGHDVHRRYVAAGNGPESLHVKNPPELGVGTVAIRYAGPGIHRKKKGS